MLRQTWPVNSQLSFKRSILLNNLGQWSILKGSWNSKLGKLTVSRKLNAVTKTNFIPAAM